MMFRSKDILRTILTLTLISVMLLSTLTGCDDFWDDDYVSPSQSEGSVSQSPDSQDTGEQPTLIGTGQRAYRVTPRGGGEDVVTLMLYLCGSDLESEGGAATSDLDEIMQANISDKLNIVVETGGAYDWQNNYVDAETNERWLITDEGPQFLQDVGERDMSDGGTLSDFISFSANNYPADRYMLVLWDHGGGTVEGYAYDERFGGEMMMIPDLDRALANAGVVFDMIGFDCCLMSTAETAFMVEKHADFMVASQRTEPGDGWHYTPWIEALSQNTSISTLDLGKTIVDSFIKESSSGYYGNELTLSVTDLTYVTDLFATMSSFFSQAKDTLVSDNTFISTAHILGSNRAITDNYDLVDLVYLVENMAGSGELLAKLKQCIVYNGTTIDNYNGLCLYFPYTDLKKVSSALGIFDQIGIDETYQTFITTFASVMVGGQSYNNGGTGNPFGGDDYTDNFWQGFDWIDEDVFAEYEDFYSQNSYDATELAIHIKGDEYVLSLSDDEWELITSIVQWVYLDDGEGYIELGGDSMYEINDDGDLLINFDNTWVALDGQLVCFYTITEVIEGNRWYSYGSVPISYNGRDAELIVMWDSDNPGGYVAGWRYTDTGANSQKGLFEVQNGMNFDYLCEYYTYDGEYDDRYFWGNMTVNGPIEVSYEDVGDGDVIVFFELFDIYDNSYWTESVIYSLD